MHLIGNRIKAWVVFILLNIFSFPSFGLNQNNDAVMVGIYWGAFDPPTSALKNIPLKKIIVVVNNHLYKKYTYSLSERIDLIKIMLENPEENNIEIMSQDETKKIDFAVLKNIIDEPLCAIAGYDAYCNWANHSSAESRAAYAATEVWTFLK